MTAAAAEASAQEALAEIVALEERLTAAEELLWKLSEMHERPTCKRCGRFMDVADAEEPDAG